MFKPKLVILALAAGGACGAYAQSNSGTLTVTGTVIAPACNVTLSGNASVDFGSMTKGVVATYPLKTNAYTVPSRNVSLNVSCNGALPLSLLVTDNRAATRAFNDADSRLGYGIGLSPGGAPIGLFTINFTALTASDATNNPIAAVSYLTRPVGSTGGWTIAGGLSAQVFNPSESLSFGIGSANPAAVSGISGLLTVTPYLMKTVIDAASAPITLDGSATITVQYL